MNWACVPHGHYPTAIIFKLPLYRQQRHMAFSSISFLFFLSAVVHGGRYFLTPTNRGKNLTTLGFSLIFYGWGQPRFVLVLLTSIAFNTVAALFIDRCEGRKREPPP